uniref:ER membrane protein complex subunit 2 n=1 Tax=Rhizophora mucronata TaxID=61149 RepID=A0A2P2NTY8_RHIMU
MARPCFKTLSERLTLSFLTKQRYSHAPPPPLST